MSKLYEDVASWMEPFWVFLICIAENFNALTISNQKRRYISDFFECLQHVLPCKECRPSYTEYIEKYPLSMKQSPIDYVSYVSKLLKFIIRQRRKESIKMSVMKGKNILKNKCNENSVSMRNPSVWGFSTWVFLHCISYAYPKHPSRMDQEHHRQFYHCLKEILPCKSCRVHLRQYLKAHSIENALKHRKSYIDYVIHMHNYINKNFTGKNEISLPSARRNILQNCKREQLRFKETVM